MAFENMHLRHSSRPEPRVCWSFYLRCGRGRLVGRWEELDVWLHRGPGHEPFLPRLLLLLLLLFLF